MQCRLPLSSPKELSRAPCVFSSPSFLCSADLPFPRKFVVHAAPPTPEITHALNQSRLSKCPHDTITKDTIGTLGCGSCWYLLAWTYRQSTQAIVDSKVFLLQSHLTSHSCQYSFLHTFICAMPLRGPSSARCSGAHRPRESGCSSVFDPRAPLIPSIRIDRCLSSMRPEGIPFRP